MAHFPSDDLRDPSPPLPGAVGPGRGRRPRRATGSSSSDCAGRGGLGVVAAWSPWAWPRSRPAATTSSPARTTSGRQSRRRHRAPHDDAPGHHHRSLSPLRPTAPIPRPPSRPDEQTTDDPGARVEARHRERTGTVALAPGATLDVVFSGNGGNFSVDADANGAYSLSGLPAGTYTVVATLTSPRAPPSDIDIGSGVTTVKDHGNLLPGANAY